MATETKQQKQPELTLSGIRKYITDNKLSLTLADYNTHEQIGTYKITDSRFPYDAPIQLVIQFVHYQETQKFIITDFYVCIRTKVRKEDNKVIDTTALFESIRDICNDLTKMGFLYCTGGKKQ